MIKVCLSPKQRVELETFRRQASSKDSEKALMVLMNADGLPVPKIAQTLKRNPHTVRDWIKRYKAEGIKGLSRKFSPGRPSDKRERVMQQIETIIGKSPASYGYQENAWTVPLITHHIEKTLKFSVSKDTVVRALKTMGYVYKRPSKTVPESAPSQEEKREAVENMVQEILEIIQKKDTVIYALDESHFSTEPYLIRGWFKKRWPPQDSNKSKARKSHILWLLESHDTKILLEKIRQVGQ